MTAYTAWYDYALPYLPGISTAVFDFEMRHVAVEFCRETCVHSVEVTPINVVAGTAEYTLTSPVTGTEPVMVKAAWFNNRPLDIAPLEILNSSNPHWSEDTGTEAWAYTQRQPDKIILYPEPDTAATAGLRVEIIVAPTLASTTLTDWIANKYMYELACGVKGKLMAQPAKPWTNPEGAAYYTALYNRAKSRAKIDATRSLTRATMSVRPRPAA